MAEIEDCVAISLPNDQLGEVVGLAIIPQHTKDMATLIRKTRMTCAAELDHHQQPRHFFIFSTFPQNAMAKLDKRRIASIAEQYLHDDLITKRSSDKNTKHKPSLYFVCGNNI
jgi:non-ribosomal peptide synthetase component E (peptide arylation enzyme)